MNELALELAKLVAAAVGGGGTWAFVQRLVRGLRKDRDASAAGQLVGAANSFTDRLLTRVVDVEHQLDAARAELKTAREQMTAEVEAERRRCDEQLAALRAELDDKLRAALVRAEQSELRCAALRGEMEAMIASKR